MGVNCYRALVEDSRRQSSILSCGYIRDSYCHYVHWPARSSRDGVGLMINIEIIKYVNGWVCDICGATVFTDALTITSWVGCGNEACKDDTLVICHECASSIRNACWQIEANQTQKVREYDEHDSDKSSS